LTDDFPPCQFFDKPAVTRQRQDYVMTGIRQGFGKSGGDIGQAAGFGKWDRFRTDEQDSHFDISAGELPNLHSRQRQAAQITGDARKVFVTRQLHADQNEDAAIFTENAQVAAVVIPSGWPDKQVVPQAIFLDRAGRARRIWKTGALVSRAGVWYLLTDLSSEGSVHCQE
jgi:hypothetical protein